jgi:hypothetical protein
MHDKKCQLIDLHSLLQSLYPVIVTIDFSALPTKGKAQVSKNVLFVPVVVVA